MAPTPFLTLAADWYRLRKGRDLAHPFIPAPRLAAWRALAAACAARDWPEGSLDAWLAGLFRMMRCYLDGLPSRDFRIDLATGEIIGEIDGGRLPRADRAPPDRRGVKTGSARPRRPDRR